MANLSIQVTIPAGGKAPISSGLPQGVAANTLVQQLIIQNNSAHSIRVGDTTVSMTVPAAVNGGTAGKGVLLTASGSLGPGSYMNYGVLLSDVWIAGTAGDVVDVFFVQ